MKKLVQTIVFAAAIGLLSSCATIVGGSSYIARVVVPNHPSARITYQGIFQGNGNAVFSVKRRDANKLTIVVQDENCPEQAFYFTRRSFRGWAFVGSFLLFTGATSSGILLPYGNVIDLATGAYWKPNVNEPGVSKLDKKNFNYILPYQGCSR